MPYTLGDYSKRTKERNMGTVYKALMEEDGELRSTIAGRNLGEGWIAQDKPRLTYKEGQITYAPEGTKGIYVWGNLERAKDHSRRNCSEEGRIHEVIPLGKVSIDTETKSTVYPAILLGKEVWREETPRPEPKFKVGDKVISGDYSFKEEWVDVTRDCRPKLVNDHVEVYYKDKYVLALGGKYSALTLNDNYKVEVRLEESVCGHFTIFHKQAI